MQAPFREVGPVAGKHFSEDHTVGISLVRPNHDQYASQVGRGVMSSASRNLPVRLELIVRHLELGPILTGKRDHVVRFRCI